MASPLALFTDLEGGEVGDKAKEVLEAQYDKGEVVSALIKELRKGDAEAAMYWAFVLEQMSGFGAVARYLYIFAAEDTMDLELIQFCGMLASQPKYLGDRHQLEHAVLWFARATKKWEAEEGRRLERLSGGTTKAVKQVVSGEVSPRPIPSYALDRHTKAGWELKRRGVDMDDRLSGAWAGVWWRIEQMEQNGKLPEINDLGEDDPVYREVSLSFQKQQA